MTGLPTHGCYRVIQLSRLTFDQLVIRVLLHIFPVVSGLSWIWFAVSDLRERFVAVIPMTSRHFRSIESLRRRIFLAKICVGTEIGLSTLAILLASENWHANESPTNATALKLAIGAYFVGFSLLVALLWVSSLAFNSRCPRVNEVNGRYVFENAHSDFIAALLSERSGNTIGS
jgi:hypothetical protein